LNHARIALLPDDGVFPFRSRLMRGRVGFLGAGASPKQKRDTSGDYCVIAFHGLWGLLGCRIGIPAGVEYFYPGGEFQEFVRRPPV
jgi:hypothetical protein